jgi:hypothetical protein
MLVACDWTSVEATGVEKIRPIPVFRMGWVDADMSAELNPEMYED